MDRQPYPATYKPPLFKRIVPALVIMPLYTLAMLGRVRLNAHSPLWLLVLAGSGFVFILLQCLSVGYCKVTLYPDRIEKKSLFGKKVIKKSDAGRLRTYGHGMMILTYKYNNGDGIVMPKGMGGDPAWNEWMEGLPKT